MNSVAKVILEVGYVSFTDSVTDNLESAGENLV
jgi:hypothetical protein